MTPSRRVASRVTAIAISTATVPFCLQPVLCLRLITRFIAHQCLTRKGDLQHVEEIWNRKDVIELLNLHLCVDRRHGTGVHLNVRVNRRGRSRDVRGSKVLINAILNCRRCRQRVCTGQGRNCETGTFPSRVRHYLPHVQEPASFENSKQKHQKDRENNGRFNYCGSSLRFKSCQFASTHTHYSPNSKKK